MFLWDNYPLGIISPRTLFFLFFFNRITFVASRGRKLHFVDAAQRLVGEEEKAAGERKREREKERESNVGARRECKRNGWYEERTWRARAGLEVRGTRAGRRIPTRRVMRTYQHRSACYLLSNGYHRSSHGRSAQRAPSKAQIYLARIAARRAAPLLKISLAIFHCDHRNWDLGFSAIRSAVYRPTLRADVHSIDRALRSCRRGRVLIITPDDDSRHGELRAMRNGIVSVSLNLYIHTKWINEWH